MRQKPTRLKLKRELWRNQDAKEWREGGMLMNGGRVECLGMEGGGNV